MVSVDPDALENAVLMVSAPSDRAEAWVHLDTGKVYVRSDCISEEADPLPDDIDTSERYVPLPDARTLDLGQALVFGFTENAMPDAYERVRHMFRRSGGYRQFGRLVDERGLRERWHAFRQERTLAALRAWCEENGLRLGA